MLTEHISSKIYLLVSKRIERDTLRCNTIEISVHLFIYMVGKTSFSTRAANYFLGKAFPDLWGAEKLCNWRASEMSETLSGVYKFELVWYTYIYMYGRTYAIIVVHATLT